MNIYFVVAATENVLFLLSDFEIEMFCRLDGKEKAMQPQDHRRWFQWQTTSVTKKYYVIVFFKVVCIIEIQNLYYFGILVYYVERLYTCIQKKADMNGTMTDTKGIKTI